MFVTNSNERARSRPASPKPPVHLPLGSDTIHYYREKMTAFEKEVAEWHEVITGTDHDDVAKR
jgi:hypothetical protein